MNASLIGARPPSRVGVLASAAASANQTRLSLRGLTASTVAQASEERTKDPCVGGVCKTCSFHGDTLVLTQHGMVPISDIRADEDFVWAKSEHTGREGWRQVIAQYSNTYDEIVEIDIRGSDGSLGTIVSNVIHPFFVEGGDREQPRFVAANSARAPPPSDGKFSLTGVWTEAGQLRPGNRLFQSDGNWAKVVDTRQLRRSLKAFNLTVADYHTYFVSVPNLSASVWVHNDCNNDKSNRLIVARYQGAFASVVRNSSGIDIQGWRRQLPASVLRALARTPVPTDVQLGLQKREAANTGHPPLPRPLNPTDEQLRKAELYAVDLRFVDEKGGLIYPKEENSGFTNGFFGPPDKLELAPGERFDRYGGEYDRFGNFSDTGSFAAPVGTSVSARALPPSYQKRSLVEYRVVKPLVVLKGPAAPWFGQEGMGVQYLTEWTKDLDESIELLPENKRSLCKRTGGSKPSMDCLIITGYIEVVSGG